MIDFFFDNTESILLYCSSIFSRFLETIIISFKNYNFDNTVTEEKQLETWTLYYNKCEEINEKITAFNNSNEERIIALKLQSKFFHLWVQKQPRELIPWEIKSNQ